MSTLSVPREFLEHNSESLAGKWVLISGGTTGIGRATAVLLASYGAQIILFGRHEQELNDAMHDVRELGGQVFGFTADVAKPEEIRRIFQEVDRQTKQLDVLVNNAALGAESILEGKYEDWQYVVNTNLLGYMAMAHEAVKRMQREGYGHIVNIGSMSADEREKGSSVYVATKAGIQGFSEALRKEANPLGIKVTLIEPGAVGTDMSQESPAEQRESEQQMEMLKAEDIAGSVLFALTQPRRCDVVSLQIRPHRQVI